ncbi:hypothetical protein GCM10010510_33960 [Streptomyces anandii JCM 4720]|nr:hypothetical protein GCM10010510_33960 [Streptomyces anandii JCM 4720]
MRATPCAPEPRKAPKAGIRPAGPGGVAPGDVVGAGAEDTGTDAPGVGATGSASAGEPTGAGGTAGIGGTDGGVTGAGVVACAVAAGPGRPAAPAAKQVPDTNAADTAAAVVTIASRPALAGHCCDVIPAPLRSRRFVLRRSARWI